MRINNKINIIELENKKEVKAIIKEYKEKHSIVNTLLPLLKDDKENETIRSLLMDIIKVGFTNNKDELIKILDNIWINNSYYTLSSIIYLEDLSIDDILYHIYNDVPDEYDGAI